MTRGQDCDLPSFSPRSCPVTFQNGNPQDSNPSAFKAPFIAKTKIKVTETARIKGNLTGAIIEVAEGATIQGSINIMNDDKDIVEFRNSPNKRLAE